jgi:putative radical SAM enzyme (TIGR03279 family)
MVRISEILPGSIAAELSLEIGSRVVRINGLAVRDTVDFRFLEADGELEVEIVPADGGRPVLYEIEKDAGEGLGIVAGADVVRQCANKCVFCFVDGNPPEARRSLHLKDDDFRLSFTYGSYVTLTNLGPRGFERLIEQRLSPLYVSVHATEPAVRERLLAVPRGGEIVQQLRELTQAGLEVHTQVVLCPGWNDGVHLDRTLDDLWSLGDGVLSVSVVPVGLTKYNLNRPVRLLAPAEADGALRQVESARTRALAERGTGWSYAGDELYFIAGRGIPPAAYYDDWPLTENGVGSVRRQLDDFAERIGSAQRLDGRRIGLLTGARMAPLFAPLAQTAELTTGATIEVVPVANTMFGETVNTAGLLPGEALLAAARDRGYDAVLLPAESLNDHGRFVDDLALAELVRALSPAHVLPAHELAAALEAL